MQALRGAACREYVRFGAAGWQVRVCTGAAIVCELPGAGVYISGDRVAHFVEADDEAWAGSVERRRRWHRDGAKSADTRTIS